MHELPMIYLFTKFWASAYIVFLSAMALQARLKRVADARSLTLLD